MCGLLTSYLVVEGLFDWPFNLSWWAVLSGLAVAATALSLRGHLLSRLLEREYFAAQRPTLGELGRQVAHVLAATDLNSGAPIYFSTAAGGTIDSPVLKTAPCPTLAVADVVRASAAFPGGFPPKRLSLARSGLVWTSRTEGVDDFERKFGWIGRTRHRMKVAGGDADVPRSLRPPRALFLSDGGVWNNLGTDWTPPLGKDDVPGSRVRLVVDASAPVASRRMGGLNVPGLAEGLAIFRTMSVLYSYTVEPRVKALDGEAAQAMRERAVGTGRWSLPAVIRVVDGREQLMRRPPTAGSAARPVSTASPSCSAVPTARSQTSGPGCTRPTTRSMARHAPGSGSGTALWARLWAGSSATPPYHCSCMAMSAP